jgi:general secretion pathway protein C
LIPVVVPALALCGWLHARGVTALVGADLGVPSKKPVGEVVALAAPDRPSAQAILARNPFDSVTGPLHERAMAAADAAGAPLGLCDDVRVVGIVTSPDPAWSFAVLKQRGEREPIFRRASGPGGATPAAEVRNANTDVVLAIDPDGVLLVHDGRRCVARLFTPARLPAPDAPVPAPAAGIVRGGSGEFVVDRATRDALIEGAAGFVSSVAVRPEKSGDEVVGLRIATLKAGTPLDALGVRAGDVLVALDGIPLTSPERMLEAFARLRTAERIHVAIRRDERPVQLDYVVR